MFKDKKDKTSNGSIILNSKPSIFAHGRKAFVDILIILIILIFLRDFLDIVYRIQVNTIGYTSFPIIGILSLFAVFIVLLFILRAIWVLASWYSISYIISTRGVTLKKGVLSQKEYFIPYYHIQDIRVSKSIMGRVFGYEDIELFSGHDNTKIVLSSVYKREEVYETIQDKINSLVYNADNHNNLDYNQSIKPNHYDLRDYREGSEFRPYDENLPYDNLRHGYDEGYNSPSRYNSSPKNYQNPNEPRKYNLDDYYEDDDGVNYHQKDMDNEYYLKRNNNPYMSDLENNYNSYDNVEYNKYDARSGHDYQYRGDNINREDNLRSGKNRSNHSANSQFSNLNFYNESREENRLYGEYNNSISRTSDNELKSEVDRALERLDGKNPNSSKRFRPYEDKVDSYKPSPYKNNLYSKDNVESRFYDGESGDEGYIGNNKSSHSKNYNKEYKNNSYNKENYNYDNKKQGKSKDKLSIIERHSKKFK